MITVRNKKYKPCNIYSDDIDNGEMKKCYVRVKKQRNILHEISKRNANCIGQILRRNCLLQQVIGGKIKGG